MLWFKASGKKAQQREFGEAALVAAEFTRGETAAGVRARLAALANRVGDRKSLCSLALASAESGVCSLADVSPLIHALVASRRNAEVEAAALLCRMLDTSPAERERLTAAISGSLRAEIREWRIRAGWRAWMRTAAVVLPVSIAWQLLASPVDVNDGVRWALLRIICVGLVVGVALPFLAVPVWLLFLGVSTWLDDPRRRRVGFRVRALVGLEAPETAAVCARLTRSRLLRPVATGGMAASLHRLTEEVAPSVTTADIGALLEAVAVVPRQEAVGVIRALGRVGSSQALPGLRRLCSRSPAASHGPDDVAQVCRSAILQIEDRLARIEASRTLLRAAAEGTKNNSLLRAAQPCEPESGEQLLRPTVATG